MVHGGAFGSGSLPWDPLYHEDARENTNSGGLHLVTFIIYVSPPQGFTAFPHSATKLGIKYSNT